MEACRAAYSNDGDPWRWAASTLVFSAWRQSPWQWVEAQRVAAAMAPLTWVPRPFAWRHLQPPWWGRKRGRWADGGGHLGEGLSFRISALASMVEDVLAWRATSTAALRFSALSADDEGVLVWMVVVGSVSIWLSSLGSVVLSDEYQQLLGFARLQVGDGNIITLRCQFPRSRCCHRAFLPLEVLRVKIQSFFQHGQ